MKLEMEEKKYEMDKKIYDWEKMNFESYQSQYERVTSHFGATAATNAETNPASNTEPNDNTGASLLVPDAVTGTTTDETEFVRIRNFDGEVPTFKMFFH